VSVVIPTLNEARNIGHVLRTLPEDVFEVILIDGGSSDGTIDAARAVMPDIRVAQQPGTGKGDALAAGLAISRGDAVVLMDADGSTDGAEIPRFVDALVAGADFVKGSRFKRGGGSADLNPLRSAGNRLFTMMVNVLFGTSYTDLCYGYNAGWRSSFDSMDLDCPGFEIETLFGIRSHTAGLVVSEVPSFEAPRLHGTSNLRPFRDGWRVLRTILRERFAAPMLSPVRMDEPLCAVAEPEQVA
jgi:glycosyltransferase involved in cell wall biosynthesis